jgi:tetratricopeptide (TPR) repeat protein
LDPLNADNHLSLGMSEYSARRSADAIGSLRHAKALAPNDAAIDAWLGYAYYQSGDYQSARTACESADEPDKPLCLALVYDKLGRHDEAKTILAKYQAERGDDDALFYAIIYTQFGDTARALDWLETAMRNHDPYLVKVKTNATFDALREEPRFQAIERALNFPD